MNPSRTPWDKVPIVGEKKWVVIIVGNIPPGMGTDQEVAASVVSSVHTNLGLDGFKIGSRIAVMNASEAMALLQGSEPN